MKKFDKITVNNDAIVGEGSYQKTNAGFIIDAESHEVLSFFRQAIRDNVRLGTLCFGQKDYESIYQGNFIVTGIKGDIVNLIKC